MSKKGWSVFEKKKPGMTPQNWRLKKVRQVFQEKNRGVTPPVAAPGVIHPSDATAACTVRWTKTFTFKSALESFELNFSISPDRLSATYCA